MPKSSPRQIVWARPWCLREYGISGTEIGRGFGRTRHLRGISGVGTHDCSLRRLDIPVHHRCARRRRAPRVDLRTWAREILARMSTSGEDVTTLLVKWSAGDHDALENLVPIVYHELHKLAASYLRRERPGTLQPTALVHEVYLRLIDQRRVELHNRTHFFGAAAQLIRRILVDHAREKNAAKR